MGLKIFSFFSGAGFLDLGFESAGFELVFGNEINEDFAYANTYSRNKMGLPKPIYGFRKEDVNLYLTDKQKHEELLGLLDNARQDGSLVGFIGGPPCPDFSVAGKNRGAAGVHGTLTQVFFDLICENAPDFFFFENVKGLWKTVKHRQFLDQMVEQARQSGYETKCSLLNSLQYDVPQDRDRIFLIGVKSEVLVRLNRQLTNFDWQVKNSLEEIKGLPWPNKSSTELFTPPIRTHASPQSIREDLTVQYWFDKNDVTHHPNAQDYFRPRAIAKKLPFIAEGDDSRKSLKRLHRLRYSPTVAYGNNEVHIHPVLNRRISVSEALSLQSLPKEFELPADMSLTAKFKTIGNGVPFLMAKGAGQAFFSFLRGRKAK